MNLRFFISALIGLAALVVISPIDAQTSKHEDARQSGLTVKPFAPGERVIFIGDSITHYGPMYGVPIAPDSRITPRYSSMLASRVTRSPVLCRA